MDWALISWLAAAGAGVAALADRLHTPRRPDDARERAAVLLMAVGDLALLAIAAFLFPFIASIRAGLTPPFGGLAPSVIALAFLLYAFAKYRGAEREEKNAIR
jgi:uncharacterized membrane protein